MRPSHYTFPPDPIRMPRWQEWAIYFAVAALLLSGALWLWFHYFMQVHGEFGDRPHPLEYLWLQLHGAAAMLSLLMMGSTMPVHIRRAWRIRRNWVTGVLLGSVLAVLVLSGYALYYLSFASGHGWVSAVHWIVGFVLVFVLLLHVLRGQLPRSKLR